MGGPKIAEPVGGTVSEPEKPCRRRWYTTWTTCDCPTCRVEARRQYKRRDAGWHQRRVTAEDAWVVIDMMLARDWTSTAIASACRLPVPAINSMLRELRHGTLTFTATATKVPAGHRRGFGPVVAARIVDHGAPTAGRVGVTGTRRRVRGLVRMGWTYREIAREAGVSEQVVNRIGRGAANRCAAPVAAAVAVVFEALQRRPGTSAQVCAGAAKAGWPPAYAWGGLDIDDPGVALPAYPEGGRPVADATGAAEACREDPWGGRSPPCPRGGAGDVFLGGTADPPWEDRRGRSGW